MGEADNSSHYSVPPRAANHVVQTVADADPAPPRSTGPHRKRAPLTSIACQACRKRKTKCDGNKPVCKNCAKKGNASCTYDLEPNQSRVAAYKQKIEQQLAIIKSLEDEVRRLKLPSRSDSVGACSSASEPSQTPSNGRGVPMRLLLNPAPESHTSVPSGTPRLPAPYPAPPPSVQGIAREAQLLAQCRLLETENRTLKELVLLLNSVDNREIAQNMAEEISAHGVSDDLLARAQHLFASQTWQGKWSSG